MTLNRAFGHSVIGAALLAVPFSFSLPSDGWSQIDELVVTTRKREENLQDVPISVSVAQAADLARQGADGLEDLTKFSPSIQFDQAFAAKDVRIGIRGLSPTRGRSNVAFLVDGIDVTGEAFNSAGASLLVSQRLLSDVERVELVKGPQSALFGRAAFAGAINYVTKEAGDEFEADLSFEAAEFNEYSINAGAGGPIIDDILGLRVSGYYWNEQGQYRNLITGDHVGGGEGFGGAATFSFNPTENLSLKFRAEYTDDEYDQRAVVLLEDEDQVVALPPEAAGIVTTPSVPNRTTFGDADGRTVRLTDDFLNPGEDYPGTDIEILRFSLIASWDNVLSGTLSSYTGYTDSDDFDRYDQDYNAIPNNGSIPGPFGDIQSGHNEAWDRNEQKIFSQELRWASDWQDLGWFGDSLQLTVGGNFWKSDKKIDSRNISINCFQYDLFGGAPIFLSHQINSACQDFNAGAASTKTVPQKQIPADSPISGPIDTWQEVFLNNEAIGIRHNLPGQKVRTVHHSIYALVEWRLSPLGLDSWKISAENRWTEENFTLFRYAGNPCTFTAIGFVTETPADAICALEAVGQGFGAFAAGQQDGAFHSPRFTLEWDITDNVLTYFSAARGTKPKGIDQLPPSGGAISDIDDFRFDSEKLNAYELGIKLNLSGGFGDILFNGAGFFNDFSDKQVSVQVVETDASGTVIGTGRRTVNAGSAEVIGLEFEFIYQPPVDGLSFNGGYTWLPRARYTEFDQITNSGADVAGAGNCKPIDTDGVPGADDCLVTFAGNRLERAPKHAFVLGASYTQPFFNTGINWFVEGDVQYQGEMFDDEDNLTRWDSWHELDLRAGLQAERWAFLVFVDNVTGNDTFRTGGSGPNFGQIQNIVGIPALGLQNTITGVLQPNFAPLPPKRQVGVRGSVNF